MSPQRKNLVVSVTLIVVLTGVSVWAQEWLCGASRDLGPIGRKLAGVPTQFGDWTQRSSGDLDKKTKDTLQCAGSLVRTYENRKTGEIVSVEVFVGPVAPIGAHTPEVCAASRGAPSGAARVPLQVACRDGSNHELWSVFIHDEDVAARGGESCVCYGWSDGGQWQAPKEARFTFVGSPYLYKIQVGCVVPSKALGPERCRKFLEEFLPVLREHMTPGRRDAAGCEASGDRTT